MVPKGRYATMLAAVAVTLAGFLGLGHTAASAEPELLVTSDPYAHQELDAPPSGVVLAFSRAVDAAAAQIVVTNSDGKPVNINSLIVEGTNVTAQVKPNLPQGTYTVHYQVNRKDGQVEGGAFQFSYGPGHWTDLPDARWSGNTAQPSVLASPSVDASTELPTAPSSADPTPAPGASASPLPAPGAGIPVGWWWAGGAAVVVVVGAVVWYILSRGRGGSHAA